MNKTYKWAEKVDKIIFKSLWGVSVLSGGSLLIVAILCTVDALGAKIFSHSIPNGTEWVTFLNIPVVFFAMGFIQVERGHTTVDLLSAKFPPIVQKGIRIVGDAIGILICFYVGYSEITLTVDKYGTLARASSSSTSFLVWPFALIIAIGFFAVGIAFLWCLIREFILPEAKRMGALPSESTEDNAIRDEEKTEGGDTV